MSEYIEMASEWPAPGEVRETPLLDPEMLAHATVTVHTIDCPLQPCTCGGADRPIAPEPGSRPANSIPGQPVTMDTPPADRAYAADFREE